MKKQFPQIIDVQIHIDPLDDEVKESMLSRLPDREDIEADLEQAWQALPQRDQVNQVRLHYLDRLIEVDLVLPATLRNDTAVSDVEALRSAAQTLDYIGKVNLYYIE